jgi:hypothetical protein
MRHAHLAIPFGVQRWSETTVQGTATSITSAAEKGHGGAINLFADVPTLASHPDDAETWRTRAASA